MIARIRKSMEEKDQGFTLIELLVVMIIIGILAAIAIPVFLNQRAKARDTSTKADISTIGKELATYYVEPSTTANVAVTQAAIGGDVTIAGGAYTATIRVSNGTAVTGDTFGPTDDATWCVTATNADGAVGAYEYGAATGLQAGTCTVAAPVGP